MRTERKSNSAFTLVELMVSLGIALLLIYGVNLIFAAVTKTVTAGNALAIATRKIRSVDSALRNDFEGQINDYNPLSLTSTAGTSVDFRWTGIIPVTDVIRSGSPTPAVQDMPRQPAITIFCQRTVAFFNQADKDTDLDGNPATFDVGENGTETAAGDDFSQPAQFPILNRRVHRTDTVGFFAGGTFVPMASAQASAAPFPEAWVWYGQTLQPSDDGTSPLVNKLIDTNISSAGGKFVRPDPDPAVLPALTSTQNTRNYFASSWMLGRLAMCVKWRDSSDVTTIPGYLKVNATSAATYPYFWGESSALPTAIGYDGTQVTPGTSMTAAVPTPFPTDTPVSAGTFSSSLTDVVGVTLPNAATEAIQTACGAFNQATYDATVATGLLGRYARFQTSDPTWWQHSMLQFAPTAGNYVPLRFNAMPSILRPWEQTGDMTTARKAGITAPALASNCSDFIVEFAGDFVTQNAATGAVTATVPDGILDFRVVTMSDSSKVRQTQWYGLARDVDGDGVADVLPVGTIAGTAMPFEKDNTAGKDYIVAFGPNELYGATPLKPSLIRLTATIADPAGNLANGLTREYIFKVR